MKWMEADPLPAECLNCKEKECYNCDTSGKRWLLSREDELRLRRKALLRSIERLQLELEAIDKELILISDP